MTLPFRQRPLEERQAEMRAHQTPEGRARSAMKARAGRIGGYRRAKVLSPKERAGIARKAAQAASAKGRMLRNPPTLK